MRSDDLHLMALLDPVTAADLKKRYHELARTLHPDVGGDAQAFAELVNAYARLMADAAKDEGRCQECRGRGQVSRPIRFGELLYSLCPRCRGSGKIVEESC